MADYITDPELLRQLNGEPATPKKEAAGSEYVTDPALLAQLNPSAPTTGLQLTEQTGPSAVPVLPISPTMPNANMSNMRPVVQPAIDVAKSTAAKYLAGGAAPLKVATDIAGLATIGVPPFAAAQGVLEVGEKAKAGGEMLSQASRLASQFGDAADTAKYFDLWNAADRAQPGIGAKITEIYNKGGGGNAVKAWLTSTDEGKSFLANPKVADIAKNYLGALPTPTQQVGRVAGAAAKAVGSGALRALGPAGLAYDVYQAGEVARETELGPRLAAGQGQLAPAAAQAMMTQRNVSGYQPTPQEAANLLASGDQRTIEMYGGAQRLAQAAAARAPQPESWMDRAMNISRKYRPQ